MIAIISLLVILTVSVLVTRIATVALTHTGLSRESARFQARSAFTGVGFTTDESEKVVNHPVRRRILLFLMLLGNAGIVTAMSSLILSFVGPEETGLGVKVVLLVAGLVALWGVSASKWVDRRLSALISRMLKRYTDLDVRDYANLLKLSGDYRVQEMVVEPTDWIADKTLAESKPRDEGVAVLGIRREDGTYVGAPEGATRVLPGDTLLLYGRTAALAELDERRAGREGDREHEEAIEEQEEVIAQEQEADRAAVEKKTDARIDPGDA